MLVKWDSREQPIRGSVKARARRKRFISVSRFLFSFVAYSRDSLRLYIQSSADLSVSARPCRAAQTAVDVLCSIGKRDKWRGKGRKSKHEARGWSKSADLLDKRLGGNMSTKRVSFDLLPRLFLPFLCATSASMQVHLLHLERLWSGRENRGEISPVSLVRKIVKYELDNEINFTNPLCEKLGELS